MPSSRRSILAAGAGLASLPLVSAATGPAATELLQRSADANAALMKGEIERYLSLVTLAEDFTLMSPFGGTPSRGSALTREQWDAIGQFFRNGTFQQEPIQAYCSHDLVVLTLIERSQVEVGGLPSQEWSLRVTLVYRRVGNTWQLAHRHADPLAAGITLDQAAALARRAPERATKA